MEMKCIFCNTEINNNKLYDDYALWIDCTICGKYAYSQWESSEISSYPKDIIAAYLYYNNKIKENERPEAYTTYIGSLSHYNGLKERHPNYFYVSKEEMISFYPRTISQKIDYSLFAFAQKSLYFGAILRIPDDEIQSLLFLRRFDFDGQLIKYEEIKQQYKIILNYFEECKYIEGIAEPNSTKIRLLAEGWKRIEKLQGTMELNRNVFVSMSFDPSLNDIREAIRTGIIDSGFSPEFMDEIIHNKEIVPEMFRLIRECRFLIMDISEPNYGAYYEAGYALGLGKEIIITCSQESKDRKFSEDEAKYEKYLRPHFDIAQKQILYWNNYADLSKKLSEWIKALFS